jgi:hypothetical protein
VSKRPSFDSLMNSNSSFLARVRAGTCQRAGSVGVQSTDLCTDAGYRLPARDSAPAQGGRPEGYPKCTGPAKPALAVLHARMEPWKGRESHLTPTQRRAYVLADNKLALNAGWDLEMLSLEIGELGEAGFDSASTSRSACGGRNTTQRGVMK